MRESLYCWNTDIENQVVLISVGGRDVMER